MAARKPSSPFDDVREAFSDLETSEKAAFVFEATFATLGQALNETGRRVAEAIDDLDVDSWFRTSHPEDVGAPPPPPKPRASPAKTSTAKKSTAKPKTPRAKTTRKKPPSDDA